MIHRSEFVEIGYLKKLYGTDGAFILKLGIQQSESFLTEKEPVFIDLDGNLVPFFLDEINEHPSDPIIHFDTISTREDASAFLSKKCFYKKSLISKDAGQPVEEFLIGCKIIDKPSGLTLRIVDINLIPNNPLVEIEVGDTVCFIPYLEDCIVDWDNQSKEIFTEYPEGLLQSIIEM